MYSKIRHAWWVSQSHIWYGLVSHATFPIVGVWWMRVQWLVLQQDLVMSNQIQLFWYNLIWHHLYVEQLNNVCTCSKPHTSTRCRWLKTQKDWGTSEYYMYYRRGYHLLGYTSLKEEQRRFGLFTPVTCRDVFVFSNQTCTSLQM